ncbi:alpha/beta fold hydrolase [Flavobacterium agricola]|uniref:Alpha/beta fold hydrolase n=1 Tax=Flavobacterium agricola TaxID=2870839 RepID=A0ABY6M289_9FLAO|nr:alpha/beta fold hydrolase [Flavobacterium agricola]UYW01363.1 alpha/beta fold hydrolase [Flavobacterium agricola]
MALSQLTIVSPTNAIQKIALSYEVFGPALGTAPVVVVNHALTGNSNVAGLNGWWTDLIGECKTINTQKFTVLAFNIPGNGYDNEPKNLVVNLKNFTTQTIARYYWTALTALEVKQVYAVIGGSLGGAIAWEMAFLEPNRIQHLIPIATNYKASDWLIGNVFIQESILNNSKQPIQDARKHAMFLYRCPAGINAKFKGDFLADKNEYKVENWLRFHGESLQNRFKLAAYKAMNHLLKTIGASKQESDLKSWAQTFTGKIQLIAVDSDLMFTEAEQNQTFQTIRSFSKSEFATIHSIHGHDAFLIEFEQITKIIKKYF